jgi:hypothetical protein
MSEKNKPNRAEIMKSRTLSDAEILKSGGEYDGNGVLQAPKDYGVMRENKDGLVSKETVETMANVLENIKQMILKINGEEPMVETNEKGENRIYSKDRKYYILIFINEQSKIEVDLMKKGSVGVANDDYTDMINPEDDVSLEKLENNWRIRMITRLLNDDDYHKRGVR